MDVLYLVDFAEIPTYQNIREFGLTPKNDDPSVATYLQKQAAVLGSGLHLQMNAQKLNLEAVSTRAIFAEGAGGLPTLKIAFLYRATLGEMQDSDSHTLTFNDSNFSGHAGWKEVVVKSEAGVDILSSSAASIDRSQELTQLLDRSAQQPATADVGNSGFQSYEHSETAKRA